MKTGKGTLIFVFLAVIAMGAMEPALLYSYETGGGNAWDQFVYDKPFYGTRLEGTLSIYYDYIWAAGDFFYCGTENDSYMAAMYYTVKLKKHGDPTYWVFQGSSQRTRPGGVCLSDILVQGEEIMNFLGDIVLGNIYAIPPIFPKGVSEWHLTAIKNAQFYDRELPLSRAFVADIVIKVKSP
jgi:hypothetical protein